MSLPSLPPSLPASTILMMRSMFTLDYMQFSSPDIPTVIKLSIRSQLTEILLLRYRDSYYLHNISKSRGMKYFRLIAPRLWLVSVREI